MGPSHKRGGGGGGDMYSPNKDVNMVLCQEYARFLGVLMYYVMCAGTNRAQASTKVSDGVYEACLKRVYVQVPGVPDALQPCRGLYLMTGKLNSQPCKYPKRASRLGL